MFPRCRQLVVGALAGFGLPGGKTAQRGCDELTTIRGRGAPSLVTGGVCRLADLLGSWRDRPKGRGGVWWGRVREEEERAGAAGGIPCCWCCRQLVGGGVCQLFDLSAFRLVGFPACRFVGKSESWRVSGARRFLGLPRGKTSAAVVWLVCRWVVAGQETRGGGGAVYPAGKREEWGRAADTGWRIQAGGERAGLGGGGRGGEYRVGGLAALGLPGGKRRGRGERRG